MHRLICLLLLLFVLPVNAGLFDKAPVTAQLGAPLNNSADFLPVSEAFKLNLISSDDELIKLRLVAAPDYYLYRHRLAFNSDHADVSVGPALLPTGKGKTDDYFGDVEVYYEVLDIDLPLNNPKQQAFNLDVTYQGCADKGLCYPPETQTLSFAGAAATASNNAAASIPSATAWSWSDLVLFFLGGLALTFTPCVLPMLPILTGVVLRGQPSGARSFALAIAYALPMALSFAILGALMGLFGAELNLQARLQSPWVLVPFALFFAFFGLSSLGFVEMRLPAFIDQPLQRLNQRQQGGTLTSAAILGVLSSVVVSPCVSAPLAGALLYISSSGDALGGGLKLFALGLGMGTPLVLLAVGGGALLPKSGPWMLVVRNAFGALLLAVAIWLLERVVPGQVSLALWGLLAAGIALWLGTLELTPKTHHQKFAQALGLPLLVYAVVAWVGALQGNDDPLRPLGFAARAEANQIASTEQWQTITDPQQLDAALAAAKTAGKPVLLDWYADWCISCKVIEREVFNSPLVGSLLGDFQLIRFDITDSNPAQRALLDRYQLFGPPAIQLFDRQGNELTELRVVGEVDAQTFSRQLSAARERI